MVPPLERATQTLLHTLPPPSTTTPWPIAFGFFLAQKIVFPFGLAAYMKMSCGESSLVRVSKYTREKKLISRFVTKKHSLLCLHK
jgi:hypothetical protein